MVIGACKVLAKFVIDLISMIFQYGEVQYIQKKFEQKKLRDFP
jgi:hypothetical protein